jgi:hypothetical protein
MILGVDAVAAVRAQFGQERISVRRCVEHDVVESVCGQRFEGGMVSMRSRSLSSSSMPPNTNAADTVASGHIAARSRPSATSRSRLIAVERFTAAIVAHAPPSRPWLALA